MIFWWILGSLFLLVFLLLLPRVWADFAYKDEKLTLRAGYLFLRFDLSPEKLAEEAVAATEKEDEKQQEEEETKLKKSKGAADTVKTIWTLVKSAKHGWNLLRRHIVISRAKIYICVATADAHQTALRYSQICLLVNAVLDVLGILFVLKTPVVGIAPDFLKTESKGEASLRIGVRPVFAAAAGISVLFHFLRHHIGVKRKRKRVKTKPKPDKQAAGNKA